MAGGPGAPMGFRGVDGLSIFSSSGGPPAATEPLLSVLARRRPCFSQGTPNQGKAARGWSLKDKDGAYSWVPNKD